MKKSIKRAKPSSGLKKLNPFEVHINKQKMQVLGRKCKNDKGLPGVSRAKAIKQRKNTLLKEYKVRDKSNKFTDRRIGEKQNISLEDKLTARFTAIRRKAHKKSIFNLADDEILTHKGQTLSEIEKFENPQSDDDSMDDANDSGKLDASFVEDAHFGGGILKKTGKEGAKTHKELIDELIAESKKRKAEKQKIKEATLELTEKLDTEWKDLLPLVSQTKKETEIEKKPVDDYDKVMRELKFEARGTVSDKLKSENEIVKEETKRMEELEKERLERMKGESNNENKFNHRSADELDDDFLFNNTEEEFTLTYDEEGKSNFENHTPQDDEIGEEKESRSESESDPEAASEDDLSDLKASDSSSEEEQEENLQEEKNEEVQPEKVENLPKITSVPDTYIALQKLFKNQSSHCQALIIGNIINLAKQKEGFKQSLSNLFVFILQHLNDCASQVNSKESIKECFEIFAKLAPKIYDLAQIDNGNAHNSLKEIIKEKHEEYRKHPKKYPNLELLLFLKLNSLLFTTSDFRHQVITPCYIFMEQILNRCKVSTASDISYGLFLVTLVLEYTTLSKRYLPAAINFLGGLLHMAVPKIGVRLIKVNHPFKPTSTHLVLTNNCVNTNEFNGKMDPSDLVQREIDDSFKIRVLNTTIKLVDEYHDLLTPLSSNVEIFKDILTYLELLPMRNYPKYVSLKFDQVLAKLKCATNERHLRYIVRETEKPKALRLYEPKIEEVIDGKRRTKIQSREKTERDKLMYKLKKETKGALREIRKDQAFLGRVKINQRIQSDIERKNKVKRIYSEAAVQQSELNSIERKKKRK